MARALTRLLASSISRRHAIRTSSCERHSQDCADTLEDVPMADTCQEFDPLIAQRAQLTAQEATMLEAHLADCGSCRELARALKPLSSDFAFATTGASE